jgi:hypothetical protein
MLEADSPSALKDSCNVPFTLVYCQVKEVIETVFLSNVYSAQKILTVKRGSIIGRGFCLV